jgi:hypothetical protein
LLRQSASGGAITDFTHRRGERGRVTCSVARVPDLYAASDLLLLKTEEP